MKSSSNEIVVDLQFTTTIGLRNNLSLRFGHEIITLEPRKMPKICQTDRIKIWHCVRYFKRTKLMF